MGNYTEVLQRASTGKTYPAKNVHRLFRFAQTPRGRVRTL